MNSLEMLQTDYIDLYMMHRDDPEIPVGDFVEEMNKHVKAGRMRAFGVSNWTTERFEEGNKYAADNGLQGFSGMSNNFALARMIKAPWDGCLWMSEDEEREWLVKTQTPLFPWASQAQGFFVPGRANQDDRSDEMLVQCWYTDTNFERQKRCFELGEKMGVHPINISLAYVLAQDFPVFPLVGPANCREVRTTMPALDIELTPEQVLWLDLRD